MAGKPTRITPRKRPVPLAAPSAPVRVLPQEETRLGEIEAELLQAGVEVEDRVELRRLALKKLRGEA